MEISGAKRTSRDRVLRRASDASAWHHRDGSAASCGTPEPAERTLDAELGSELLHRVSADALLVLEDLDDLLADCGIRCHRLLLVIYVGRVAQVDGRTPETKNPRGSPSAILAVSETKLACRGHIEAEEDNRS